MHIAYVSYIASKVHQRVPSAEAVDEHTTNLALQKEIEDEDIGYEMSLTEPRLTHYFVTDNKPSTATLARGFSLTDEDELRDEQALAVISLHNHALVVCVCVCVGSCYAFGLLAVDLPFNGQPSIFLLLKSH